MVLGEHLSRIGENLILHRELKFCKSFQFVPANAIASGMVRDFVVSVIPNKFNFFMSSKVRNVGLNNQSCLDCQAQLTDGKMKVLIYNCHGMANQVERKIEF